MKKFISVYIICILIVFLGCQSGSNETFKVPVSENDDDSIPCGLEGSAHNGNGKLSQLAWEGNPKKNRSDIPDSSIIKVMKIQDLIAPDANKGKFEEGTPVQVTGYVVTVKHGGKESCNCETTDPKFMDTHIELTPDSIETDAAHKLIVEVTPRLREQMEVKGIDWSTATLHEKILHHTVTIQGWLFYDAIHEPEAFSTNPANTPNPRTGKTPNWRASCWEVHPITAIQVENAPIIPH